jgi:hypothetical protein
VGSGGGMWDLRLRRETHAGRGAPTAGGGEWRATAVGGGQQQWPDARGTLARESAKKP